MHSELGVPGYLFMCSYVSRACINAYIVFKSTSICVCTCMGMNLYLSVCSSICMHFCLVFLTPLVPAAATALIDAGRVAFDYVGILCVFFA